jgi:hypothetical protein
VFRVGSACWMSVDFILRRWGYNDQQDTV